jgi:hypothetical protein
VAIEISVGSRAACNASSKRVVCGERALRMPPKQCVPPGAPATVPDFGVGLGAYLGVELGHLPAPVEELELRRSIATVVVAPR